MPVIDVVSVSVKPTCVTKRAVDALNRHLGPRAIHVVSVGQEQCAAFRGHAPNVRCWLEDQMLRGVTKAGVGQYISRRFHKQGGEEYMGRSLQGWYFQQASRC
jgi:GTP cyclohydrolase I